MKFLYRAFRRIPLTDQLLFLSYWVVMIIDLILTIAVEPTPLFDFYMPLVLAWFTTKYLLLMISMYERTDSDD